MKNHWGLKISSTEYFSHITIYLFFVFIIAIIPIVDFGSIFPKDMITIGILIILSSRKETHIIAIRELAGSV